MVALGRYRALLTLPGARWPVLASAVGSLPIGMYILGIVLLGREATGSFADAGRVAGAFGLANALGAVSQGRLMDRIGQPRVLRPAAAAHAVAISGLVVAASERAPTWTLALCAAAGGLSLPQVPAAMRSLWGSLVTEPEERESAYALVAIVFEVSIVAAPALVAVIAAVSSPEAAVLTAASLAVAGGIGFAATAGSRGWRGEPHESSGSARSRRRGCAPCSPCSPPLAPRWACSRSRCPLSAPSGAQRRKAAWCSRRSPPGAWPAGCSTDREAGPARSCGVSWRCCWRSVRAARCWPSRIRTCCWPRSWCWRGRWSRRWRWSARPSSTSSRPPER